MNRKTATRRTRRPAYFRGNSNRSVFAASFGGHSPFPLDPMGKAAQAPRQASREPCSLADWIGLIREACSRGAGSTLELARLMSQARQSLPYGSWSRLWQSDGLPFSKRKGEKLVVIGQSLEGIDANNCSHLPAAWNTLYYLARLGRRSVERLIEQGRIHTGLSLREAKALLAEHQPQMQRKSPRSNLRARLARFAAFIRADLGIWSPTERGWAGRQLTILVAEIQGAAGFPSFPGQPSLETSGQPGSMAQTLGEPFISKL